MDTTSLKEAGLTEGEIKVYLALIELGYSTSGPIIKKSGVARSIIYQLLEKLIQKGLVSHVIKGKIRYFKAEEPYKILEYIDEREKKLKQNKEKVERLIPALLKQRNSEMPEAQIYEGFKGIQTVHEHTYLKLKKGEEYYYVGIPSFQDEKYHTYWMQDHKKRENMGIKCKLLFNQGTDSKILKNRNKFKTCDARYLPFPIHTPAWFMGYKDITVIGLQSKNGMAIEIINQDIADSFRAYFEEFWKKSKPFVAK